jgi:D-inositol-3-phosphate glycosyltransferase
MAKILWISDLVVETGFSRVAHALISRLQNDYEIIGLGINYFGDPHKFGFDIYPARIGNDIYGFSRVSSLIKHVKPDLIFILNDAWIQDRYLEIIKASEFSGKVVTYTPVDGENHYKGWYDNFDIVSKAIFYTQFGANVAKNFVDEKKITIIPHGLDKSDFYRLDADINELRREFLKTDRFSDAFIVLNANRNQPRKRLDITMQAFAEFAKDKPDAYLYMHCGVIDASMDIINLAKTLGIYDRLVVSNTDKGIQQISRKDLNIIYNITDVGVNTSWGEGWGLVNFEHASVGKPQVVPNHTSFPEVFEDTAVYIDPVMILFVDNQMTTASYVHPIHVAKGLDILYKNRDLYNTLSEKSLKRFSDSRFSWDMIANRFKDVFDEVLLE